MTRLWLLTFALLVLTVLACGGPNCDRYCVKRAECAAEYGVIAPDLGECVASCQQIGADKSRTIDCVIAKTCKDIQAGACTPTGPQ